MHQLRRYTDQALEAQRWQASQAARPELTPREQALGLHSAMQAAKAAGDLDRARELAGQLRGWLWALE